MPLILAIESDPRQARRIAALTPAHVDAEIVVVESVQGALDVLRTRTPDLVLTPLLLSAKDDALLTGTLREVDRDDQELPTLVTPVLASGKPQAVVQEKGGGLLNRLRRSKSATAASTATGCAPAVFAEQVTEYLARIAAERRDREEARRADVWNTGREAASAPMLTELLPMPALDSFETVTAQEKATILEFSVPPHSEEHTTTGSHEDTESTTTKATHEGTEDTTFSTVEREEVLATADTSHDDTTTASHDDTKDTKTETVERKDTTEVSPELTTVEEHAVAAESPEPEAQQLEAVSRDDDGDEPPPELEVQPVSEPDEDDAAIEPAWEDLESFLEDLELEDNLSAASAAVPVDEAAPDVIELPSPDELWAPLATAPQPHIAPIEGPAMKKRRAAPAKTPKAKRSKSTEALPETVRKPRRPKAPSKPMQDEWGLYDPEQCGFAALLERLKEINEDSPKPTERKGRSAIMRR